MKQYKTYNGNAPYLFVSYAHKDSERVLPFIEELDRNNYRLWYDAGINVGANWPEVVASHLLNSSKVIFFISENFLKSQNCIREVNYAVAERKDMLCVLMDEIKLPEDLSMQLSTITKISMSSFPETLEKVKKELGPSLIGDGIEGYETTQRSNASANLWRIISLVFASLFIIAAIFIFGYFNNWFSFAGVDTVNTSDLSGKEVEITEFKDNVSRNVLLKAYDGSSLYFCGDYMVSDPEAIRYRNGEWYVADNKAAPSEFGDLSILTDKDEIEYLALVQEGIEDASKLSAMSQLVYLDLSGNPLSDVSFLKDLDRLQILKLIDTEIDDLSVLNSLGELKYLYISYDALENALEYIDTSKVDLIIKK
jgi:Leucine-rich repeat (LRR) protein